MFTRPLDLLRRRLAIHARRKRAERLRARAMGRPFGAGAGARLLLVTQPERIPQSQIFPFHHYADDLRRLFGAELREVDLGAFLAGADAPKGATTVAFQTPFDVSDDALDRLFARIATDHPGARVACLDWFAPIDLRNAARLDGRVDVYVKKHLLRDRSAYGKPTRGDTNLTDFFDRRYGIAEPERCFAIPPGFLDKLLLGPSFATAPQILPLLMGPRPAAAPRPIDLHARFATGGTPWYQGMRGEAEAALARVADLAIRHEGAVPLPRFMAEMEQSKFCFSPFGYGEVCWRDYEAVAGGAVLLKPDMSHVETAPDIFVPWETYVPLRWDLQDFEDSVRRLAGDAALRERIAGQAHRVLHDWLHSDAFARTMAPLFG